VFGFSGWTLPVFVQVTSGGSAAAVGETYVFAKNSSWLPTDLNGTAIDWSLVTVATATWASTSAAASLLDFRTRGRFNGANDERSFGVWGNFFGFELESSGTSWTFSNGQQKYYDYHMLAERQVHGFTRVGNVSATVYTVNVTDGTECGTSPGAVGSPNPCTNSSTMYYYLRLPRG
jgi:hypothetical protein